MAGYTTEEVKEFVINRIENWMADLDILEEASEHRHLEFIRDNIQGNRMLTKEEAKTLERRLEDECKFVHDHTYRDGQSYILHIDSLGIYAEVWARYCRPGTYMTVL